MPPKVRFSSEAVVTAAFEIARERGMDEVNARAIAQKMGCSTQPLFRAFQSMEQIRQAVRARANEAYAQSIAQAMTGAALPYKASGMAYLRFAQDEPELFKLLFMYDRGEIKNRREAEEDQIMERVVEILMKNLHLTKEQAREFHLNSWIFVHGMASMIATNYVSFTEEEAQRLLSGSYKAMRLLFEQQRTQEAQSDEAIKQ